MGSIQIIKRIFNLEFVLFKAIKDNRAISWNVGGLLLVLTVFLTMWEPMFLIQIFNSLLWILSFGQIMPASWFGLNSNVPHLTLWLVIKLSIEGEHGWYGILNQGGYGIGIILFSLISLFIIPIIRINLSNHIKDIQSVSKAKKDFIEKYPNKFNTEQELYKEVKDFIFLHMEHLSHTAHKRHRREFIISSMVIELWTNKRQHKA